jgi:hypothetical protein
MAVLLYGNEKRRVHFRIIDSAVSTGTERRFGLTEYLYCDKHCTWHEQKNEAFVPISDWSKLVGFTELLDIYAKPIVEQMLSEKSNVIGEKSEEAAKPECKQDEALTRKVPPPPEYCDDGFGQAIAVGYGCAPTGTPEQR